MRGKASVTTDNAEHIGEAFALCRRYRRTHHVTHKQRDIHNRL